MWKITFCQQAGIGRKVNQDALFNGRDIFQYKLKKAESFLAEELPLYIGIADGISSSPHSHRASRFLMEQLAMCNVFTTHWLRQTQQSLSENLSREYFGSASTFIGAKLDINGKLKLINVGDSRAYKITKQGEWQQLSYDHSMLSELREQGLVDEKTEYSGMYRSLTDCLVADMNYQDFRIFSTEVIFQEGDSLLLCSDGFSDYLSPKLLQQIWQRYTDSRERLTACRKMVKKHRLYDDFSAILCEFFSEK